MFIIIILLIIIVIFLVLKIKFLKKNNNSGIEEWLEKQAYDTALDLIQYAKAISIPLNNQGNKSTIELCFLFLSLWMWYKSEDKLKILFFDKL